MECTVRNGHRDCYNFSQSCESSSGSISLSRCQLIEAGYSAHVLHLNDPSSRGTIQNGRVQFHFDNNDHICGTRLVANGTHIIYENFILGTPESAPELNQQMFVEVGVDGVDSRQFATVIDTCWATPVNDPDNSLRWDLITGEMFIFNANATKVYLHCSVHLCLPANNNCSANCSSGHHQRTGRYLDFHHSSSISMGPLVWSGGTSDFFKTCESSSGSISLSRCQLFEAGFSTHVRHPNDPSCRGTIQNGRVQFHFDNNDHICGTNLVANGTHIIYENFILGTPESAADPVGIPDCDLLLHQAPPLLLDYTRYQVLQILSPSELRVELPPWTQFSNRFSRRASSGRVNENLPAGEGRYQVRMVPYQDSEFSQPFTGHVESEIDKNDPDYSLRWDLITGECPNPQDNTVELLQNGVSTSSRFSFRMFIFSSNSTKVNNNGHLTFDGAWSSFSPYPFPAYGGKDIIAPFWTDIDNRGNGVISYQQYTSGDVLTQATQDINQYFPDLSFSASWVFVATWDRVAYYPQSGTNIRRETCTISGDPHYYTFDNQVFHFQGTCTYVLSEACRNGLPYYRIEGKNEHRGSTHVSWTRMVRVIVYHEEIELVKDHYHEAKVNGTLTATPFSLRNGSIQVYQSGFTLAISTDFGLVVTYDAYSWVTISVPYEYQNATCGLCGNFNLHPEDDFRSPSGEILSSDVDFANSWKAVGDTDPGCHSVRCMGLACADCSDDEMSVYGDTNHCGILGAVFGPFSACHSVFSAQTYMDSCMYDLCLGGGYQPILCQALNVYAAQCQQQGVQLGQWRRGGFCEIQCPEHSHFEFNGTSCPATCTDTSAPMNCPLPNQESCICDVGYIVSAGTCVPVADCGCTFEGFYYAEGQSVVLDEDCGRQCVCSRRTMICHQHQCGPAEVCEVHHGVRGCRPTSYASCSVEGLGFYHTFDGQTFRYPGACGLTLARVMAPSQLPSFLLTVEKVPRGHQGFARFLKFEAEGTRVSIEMGEGSNVQVDGQMVGLPISVGSSQISIYHSGVMGFVLETNFGVTIRADWPHIVRITVPSTYSGSLGGLCGNLNGNITDEYISPDGVLLDGPQSFADSWRDGSLSAHCEDPTDLWESGHYQNSQFSEQCSIMTLPFGPFAECRRSLDPTQRFQDCIHMLEQTRGAREALCEALRGYTLLCQQNGIAVGEWRNFTHCEPTCPPHAHYELCGTSCPASCPSLSFPFQCTLQCQEGCQCNDGLVLNGDQCVPPMGCGCRYAGRYRQPREQFWHDEECQSLCVCDGITGNVHCTPSSCSEQELCSVVEGEYGCHPSPHASCSASGDPHYISFDGTYFDFQGTCRYVLATVCNDTRGLSHFQVDARNEAWHGLPVSITVEVFVNVSGHLVHMSQDLNGYSSVQVDGEIRNLPILLDSGRVSVYSTGSNTLVSTDFGLSVTYGFWAVNIIVPADYRGITCGLCGNFNGHREDDFMTLSGSLAPSLEQFGAEWKVEDEIPCNDGCGNNCPLCQDHTIAHAMCEIIRDNQGPFSFCHPSVDPQAYFNDCSFDVCLSGNLHDVLCHSIQSYVRTCQSANAVIYPWRESASCGVDNFTHTTTDTTTTEITTTEMPTTTEATTTEMPTTTETTTTETPTTTETTTTEMLTTTETTTTEMPTTTETTTTEMPSTTETTTTETPTTTETTTTETHTTTETTTTEMLTTTETTTTEMPTTTETTTTEMPTTTETTTTETPTTTETTTTEMPTTTETTTTETPSTRETTTTDMPSTTETTTTEMLTTTETTTTEMPSTTETTTTETPTTTETTTTETPTTTETTTTEMLTTTETTTTETPTTTETTTTEMPSTTETTTTEMPTETKTPVTDPCLSLNCTEDEWCGERNGVYGCFCKDNQTRHEPHSFDFSETCENSSGSISLSRCQLFEAGFSAHVLHLNDRSCRGIIQNGRVQFHFNNNDHICGTNLVANGTHITYENFILGTPESAAGLISREKILKLNFSCIYPQTQTLSMIDINPLETILHRILPAGEGRYQVRMVPYQDSEFSQPFTGRVDAELNQQMFVEVGVDGVDRHQFVTVIDTCWATPVNDPDYSLHWDLITGECPNPQDNTVELLQNGVSTSSRFSFKMFIFNANATKVYLHCSVHLCLLNNKHCSADCHSGHHQRMGRSVDFYDSSSISMGPLVWSGGASDFSETCENSSGSISLSRCQLFEAGFSAHVLHLNDRSCRGTIQNGRVHFHFDNNDHICGTRLVDSEFSQPFTGRVDAELNQQMFVEVGVDGVDSRQFATVIDTCWATPVNDPDYSLHWDLITGECPNPQDNTVELLKNGASTSSRFSFRMFIFNANATKVYLYCSVHLCLLTNNHSLIKLKHFIILSSNSQFIMHNRLATTRLNRISNHISFNRIVLTITIIKILCSANSTLLSWRG
ncbi:Alpha-tectorin Precursor [Triplophysa tibetana]|uniref:Alpha-tectorin n=1 Tax=Triplophysa tibetana TaxID=1572043 RepID=A0A5A9PT59_9TELE|nr:Alpha-tectorin Precursor [Triplophysa tibetana]